MNLEKFKASLAAAPAAATIRITLPDGGVVPVHFHVTEVGHVRKDFIDCGGKSRATRSCVLQTWTGSSRDDGHRLTAGTMLKILALARPLFADEDLPVEVEHENALVSQFPLVAVDPADGEVVLRLGSKHTDCLAREQCGVEPDATGAAAEAVSACCGGPSQDIVAGIRRTSCC